jgi:hypothetical protein
MKQRICIQFILLLVLISACERNDKITDILKFYGDIRDDLGYSIAAGDDGYYICGQLTEVFRENGNHITGSEPRIGVIKTDFNGNMIWKKMLGGKLPGTGSKIIVTDDGSLVCVGQVTDTVLLKTDIFVAMLDKDGILRTDDILKLDDNQTSTDILQTRNGFLILGTTDTGTPYQLDSAFNIAGYQDLLLVNLDDHLDMTGNPLQWGFPWNDRGVALKNDRNGGFIIAGTTDRHANRGRKNDIFILRINDAASIKEHVILDSKADEYAADMEVLDDSYLIAGTSGSESELQKPWFARVPFNIYDTVLYPDAYANNVSWSVNAICRYRNNYFVAAGKEGSGSSADMLFFVFDEWGNIADGDELITGSTGSQVAYDVVSDSENNVIGIGKNVNETNSMISFFKFRF